MSNLLFVFCDNETKNLKNFKYNYEFFFILESILIYLKMLNVKNFKEIKNRI
jgi:hypothetical protein